MAAIRTHLIAHHTRVMSLHAEEQARVLLALLRTLPSMGRHSAALPLVLRALQQVCPPGEASSTPIHTLAHATTLRVQISQLSRLKECYRLSGMNQGLLRRTS